MPASTSTWQFPCEQCFYADVVGFRLGFRPQTAVATLYRPKGGGGGGGSHPPTAAMLSVFAANIDIRYELTASSLVRITVPPLAQTPSHNALYKMLAVLHQPSAPPLFSEPTSVFHTEFLYVRQIIIQTSTRMSPDYDAKQ